MIQKNLVLCKAKVDLTNSSGEQYKVTRYIYRTVIDLIPGTIISELLDKGKVLTIEFQEL